MREAPKAGSFKAPGMRGRPITTEEFERMLAVVPKVRPQDAAAWQHYLRGLWLSGLRLAESIRLTWDADGDFVADLSGRRPCFRIAGKAQKSGRTEVVPMAPEFAEFLVATPEADRHGRVFRLSNLIDGSRMTHERVGLIVGRFGEKAGVVVNKDEGRTATAHDLRRSFGTRWAKVVMPASLQRLMRHQSISTTMRHYVGLQCDEVSDQLWSIHEARGNTSGNTPTVAQSVASTDGAGSIAGSDCATGGYGDDE
jgi:integrase